MTTGPDDIPQDDSLLAAEYVLRLLDPVEDAAFRARLATEPALAAEMTAWTTRLSGLDADVAEVAPRPAVKTGLERRLFGQPQRLPFWRRVGLWQAVSLASVALAAFLALQSLQPPQPVAPTPLFVSEIAAEDQSLRLLAVYDAQAAELRLTRTAGSAAEGRVLQLWAIAGDAAPVSLGVLPETGTTAVILPEALRAGLADLVLAISDEPAGGSPTGAPTGAVLAVGQVSAL
ncbi:hypothetical protein A8B83_07815 [Rhodobacteraceae bacterium EhC02]|nr:hypothetical protein A8B83_07815 [Rhodobacteraceae bacterium EhC02]